MESALTNQQRSDDVARAATGVALARRRLGILVALVVVAFGIGFGVKSVIGGNARAGGASSGVAPAVHIRGSTHAAIQPIAPAPPLPGLQAQSGGSGGQVAGASVTVGSSSTGAASSGTPVTGGTQTTQNQGTQSKTGQNQNNTGNGGQTTVTNRQGIGSVG